MSQESSTALLNQILTMKMSRRAKGLRSMTLLVGYKAAAKLHDLMELESREVADALGTTSRPVRTIVGARVYNLKIDLCRGCEPDEVRII